MTSKPRETTDAVQLMRSLREQLAADIEGKDFASERRYLDERLRAEGVLAPLVRLRATRRGARSGGPARTGNA